eukprot:NODE_3701_length_640_cov_149.382403_g2660_i0.p1 GENE.NODE_3701_length_640_cov_149.382403_g2660_i0~~NODE_3701_length_640_cov_149.382403_g2660_i0.p1  ORF type:complete len:95 (-),score=4.54 NODE_3701_length_640_cov_149.382403_g2660_i0:241-525(-)
MNSPCKLSPFLVSKKRRSIRNLLDEKLFLAPKAPKFFSFHKSLRDVASKAPNFFSHHRSRKKNELFFSERPSDPSIRNRPSIRNLFSGRPPKPL